MTSESSTMTQLLEAAYPDLKAVMSRDGRILRNKLFEFVTSETKTKDVEQFAALAAPVYDRTHWEKAVLYAAPHLIFEVIKNRVATKQKKNKEIHWQSVLCADPEWWEGDKDLILKKRNIIPATEPSVWKGHVNDQFCAVYNLYVKWVLNLDFGLDQLYTVFELSREFSPDEVSRCMDMVSELEKCTAKYLKQILLKEQALMLVEVQQHAEVTAYTKKVLTELVSAINKPRENIDWNKLEEELKTTAEYQAAHDKVKLS